MITGAFQSNLLFYIDKILIKIYAIYAEPLQHGFKGACIDRLTNKLSTVDGGKVLRGCFSYILDFFFALFQSSSISLRLASFREPPDLTSSFSIK